MAPPVTPSPHRFLSAKQTGGIQQEQAPEWHMQHLRTSCSQHPRPTQRFQSRPTTQRAAESIESPTTSPPVRQISQGPNRWKQGSLDEITSSPTHISPGSDGQRDNVPRQPPSKRRRMAEPMTQTRQNLDAHDLVILSSSPPASRSPSPSPTEGAEDDWLSRLPHITGTAPRFLLHQTLQSQAPLTPRIGNPDAPLLKTTRPGFVLPSMPTQGETNNSLSTAFSPYKKGRLSFVSGGLANALRDWILELETSPVANGLDEYRRKRLDIVDEATTVRINEVADEGSGLWHVKTAEKRGWLLIGPGGYGYRDLTMVRPGCTVLIRSPIWDAVVQGQRRSVAVRWDVAETSSSLAT